MKCSRPVVIGLLSTAMLSMASALAWADDGSLVLDLVRHGETLNNLNGIVDTAPPGAPLDETGIGQANDVANSIYGVFKDNISGLFASDAIRTQQTAAPLAELLSSLNNGDPFPVETLSGLNEIPAGVFEGQPRGASLSAGPHLLDARLSSGAELRRPEHERHHLRRGF